MAGDCHSWTISNPAKKTTQVIDFQALLEFQQGKKYIRSMINSKKMEDPKIREIIGILAQSSLRKS
jgi:hypothetical protein